jgi:hypothetical protein
VSELIIRGIAILAALSCAVWGGYRFRNGAIFIQDIDEPGRRLTRTDQPIAFWSFVTFWYFVNLAIIVIALFLPAEH